MCKQKEMGYFLFMGFIFGGHIWYEIVHEFGPPYYWDSDIFSLNLEGHPVRVSKKDGVIYIQGLFNRKTFKLFYTTNLIKQCF